MTSPDFAEFLTLVLMTASTRWDCHETDSIGGGLNYPLGETQLLRCKIVGGS